VDKKLLDTIRKNINEKNLDAVLITNIYKILNLIGINKSFNFFEVGFYLLITYKHIYFIGDPFSLSIIKIPKGVKKEEENIKELRENGMRPIKLLRGILKRLKIKKIGSFEEIEIPGYKIIKIDDPFLNLYLFPDENRISIMDKNAKICEKVLTESLNKIKIGIPEIRLRNIIDENIYLLGGERRAFPTKVIFGKNTSNPFSISNYTKLKDGDSIIINFGLIRKGVGMEVGRTFKIGKDKNELDELHKKASNIYKKFIDFLTPGKVIKEIHKYVLNLIEENNLQDNFIEPISAPISPLMDGIIISPNNSSVLRPGVCLSVQLGFYFPGKYGVRFQDILIMRENAEILTNFFNNRGLDVISYQV
jgi:Xaa-Pro aminopeptidase